MLIVECVRRLSARTGNGVVARSNPQLVTVSPVVGLSLQQPAEAFTSILYALDSATWPTISASIESAVCIA